MSGARFSVPAALAAIRFVASVAVVSGALLIADVAATLTWQEPLSALIAHRAQVRLRVELAQAARSSAADARALRGLHLDRRARLARLAAGVSARVDTGHALGRVELPTLGRSYVVVQGTGTAALRKGPGHYPGSPLPGQPGTVAVAGHRTTFGAPFRTLDRLRRGSAVVMAMPYGRFVYRVQRTSIVKPTAVWVKRAVGYDRLILTACHPLYSAAERIVVFARLTAVPGTEDRSRDSNHSRSAPTSTTETTTTVSQ